MQTRLRFLVVLSLGILLLNSVLLWAFPTATAFNVANLLLHVGLGAVAGVLAILCAKSDARMGWTILASLSGVLLAVIGNTRDHKMVWIVHIVLALVGVAVLFARREYFRVAGISTAVAALALVTGLAYRYLYPHPEDRITNTLLVPTSMNEEGAVQRVRSPRSGANTASRQNGALRILHGVEEMRRMPQGHLSAVEKLHASLLVL